MRALLVCPISQDFAANQGILAKMSYQRNAFGELCDQAHVVCNSERGPVFEDRRIADYPLRGRVFNSINHYALFFHFVLKHCRPAQYDFLYIRYPLSLPPFLWFIGQVKRLNPDTKIVVEVPTFPYEKEFTSPKQRILLNLDRMGRGRLRNATDVVVTFYGQDEIWGVPCIRTQNGIGLEELALSKRKRGDEEPISFISVGNLARWHGIDRFLQGLSRYRKRPDAKQIQLHVVGDGPARAELEQLRATLQLNDCVHYHGIAKGAQLDALFDQADIALGALAMHRLQMTISSSLKSREYCARGIPFVQASEDPDFPQALPFVHHVATNESPVDLGSFVAFFDKLDGQHFTIRTQMREYAEQHLTWRTKLQPVIDFLQHNI